MRMGTMINEIEKKWKLEFAKSQYRKTLLEVLLKGGNVPENLIKNVTEAIQDVED